MDGSAVRKFEVGSLGVHTADWEELALLDPMWAILSETEKHGNRWGVEEFFYTGKQEIDQLIEEVGLSPESRGSALDFGCGIGRLTRALRRYYPEVHGVDISENMIEKARQITPECKFHVNKCGDLALFPDSTFDLIYSNRVLQHLPSAEAISVYVREFFRVAVPGGVVVFQVPDRKSLRNIFNLKRTAYHLLKALGVPSEVIFERLKLHPMRMTAISRKRVRSIIRESTGELVKERPDVSAHYAVLYFCRRRID